MAIVILGGNGFLGQSLKKALKARHFVAISSRTAGPKDPSFIGANDYVAMRNFLVSDSNPVVINCVTNYGRNGESVDVVHAANFSYPENVIINLRSVPNLLFLNIGTSMPAASSAYAQSKNELEAWLLKQSLVRVLNLKTELFYGLELPAKNMVSRLIVKGFVDEGMFPMTSGKQRRDFIHVDDVVGAVSFALDKKWERDEFLLGTGETESIRGLCDRLHELIPNFKTKIGWGLLPDPVAQPNADVSLPRFQSVGWKPLWNLSSGLENVVEQYRSYFSK